jgi:NitT/TauT family transport system substrate-binding protein
MKRSHLLAGLASAPLLVPSSFSIASAQEMTTVRVGVLGISTDSPIYIADEKGYFRDQGIKVEFVKFTSSETMMPLLAGKDLDFGSGAPGASLYNAVNRGIEVRAVADAATDPPGYGWSKLLVRSDLIKSGKFKTIKDLKGMTIAGAARASSSAAQVTRLVAQAGLKYSDVKRTVLSYPNHVVALQNGSIEASLTIEPFATIATDSGSAVAITGNDSFYPNQEVSCVLCSADLIGNKRDVIVRYLRAFLKGVRYYQTGLQNGHFAGPNSDEIVRIIATHTGAPEQLIRRTVPVAIDPNGRLNLGSMREDLVFYKSQGFIEGDSSISVERVIDASLSAEATKTIGIERRRV